VIARLQRLSPGNNDSTIAPAVQIDAALHSIPENPSRRGFETRGTLRVSRSTAPARQQLRRLADQAEASHDAALALGEVHQVEQPRQRSHR
jgi:hypothetical protein